jgi:hypothetical protein
MASTEIGHIMDRRDFLKTTGALIATGAIRRNPLTDAFSTQAAAQSGRLVLPIETGDTRAAAPKDSNGVSSMILASKELLFRTPISTCPGMALMRSH